MLQNRQNKQGFLNQQELKYFSYESVLEDERLQYLERKSTQSSISQANSITPEDQKDQIQKITRYYTGLVSTIEERSEEENQRVEIKRQHQGIKFKTPLELYEDLNKKEDYIMNFDQPRTINSLLFQRYIKDIGRTRAIATSQNSIAIGGSLGNVLVIWNGTNAQGSLLIETNKNFGAISALDLSEDGKMLAVGSEKGFVAIVNTEKNEILKICKDAHQSRVILIKFLFVLKKYWITFSGDDSNLTRIIHFEKNMLGLEYQFQLSLERSNINLKYPLTQASILNRELYPLLDDQECKQDSQLVAFVSVDQLLVIRFYKDIDQKFEILYMIQSPCIGQQTNTPLYSSVTWGEAKIQSPSSLSTEYWKKSKLVLFVSFNNFLYILVYGRDLDIHDEFMFKPLNPIVFPIREPILHVVFFSQSVIGVCTQDQNFYLISTKYINLHIIPYSIDHVEHLIFKQPWKGKALTSLLIVSSIQQAQDYPRRQSVIEPPKLDYNSPQAARQTWQEEDFHEQVFLPLVCSFAKTFGQNQMFVLTEKQISSVVLCDWKVAADQLAEGGDWASAMFLIKSMRDGSVRYSTNMHHLPEQIFQQTKKLTTNYLNRLLNQLKYVLDTYKTLEPINEVKMNSASEKTQAYKKSYDLAKSTLCLLMDFLLVAAPDILFDQVYKILKGFLKGQIYLFANELRNFIEGGKIQKLLAPGEVVSEIIEYYAKEGAFLCIDKFVKSLDLSQIETEPIVSTCLSLKLIKPLIHVSTNSKEKDFAPPLAKLWGMFLDARGKKQYDLAIKNGLTLLSYLKKLVDLCSTQLGQKKIDLAYEQTIENICEWLVNYEIVVNLFSVDLLGTIEIISQLFQPPISDVITKSKLVYKIVQKGNKNSNVICSIIDKITNTLSKIEKDFQDQPLVKLQMIQQSTMLNRDFPWQIFVQQVITVYECLYYLWGYKQTIIPQHFNRVFLETDSLNLLPLSVLDVPVLPASVLPITKELANFALYYSKNAFLIRLCEKNKAQIKPEQLQEYAQVSQFNYLQVYLTEIQKQYVKALDLKIFIQKKYGHIPIEQNLEIFQWIEDILSNDSSQRLALKDRVLHHLNILVQISPTRTRIILQKHFTDSEIGILAKLRDSPHLQLEYLENILATERANKNNPIIDQELLRLHLKLLCQLAPKRVIEEIKQGSYPCDTVIEICSQYKIADALSYQLERQGSLVAAVKARTQNIAMNDHKALLKVIEELILLCVRNNRQDENDEAWVTLVDEMLAFKNLTKNEGTQALIEKLLKKVFEQWSQFSHVNRFLDLITDKYANLDAVRLTSTFMGMYESELFLENIFQISKDIYQARQVTNMVQLQRQLDMGILVWGFCFCCIKRLNQGDLSGVIVFTCGHAFHSQCIEIQQYQLVRSQEDFYYKCPICCLTTKRIFMDIINTSQNRQKQLRQSLKNSDLQQMYLIQQMEQEVRTKKNILAQKLAQTQEQKNKQKDSKFKLKKLEEYEQKQQFRRNEFYKASTIFDNAY